MVRFIQRKLSPIPVQHLQLLGSFPKINQASSERNTDSLYSTAEAQTKQNPLSLSLWRKNKSNGALERKQILLLSVASVHKLSTISVLILDEQQKSSYSGNQTCPIIQRGGHNTQGVKVFIFSHQNNSVHKSLVHIPCDANFRIQDYCEYFHMVLFLLATLAAFISGKQCWLVIISSFLYITVTVL